MDECSKAPSNAKILFDDKPTSNWTNSNWKLIDGVMESSKGNTQTKQKLGSGHYHVEWRVVDKESLGNSVVYLQGIYELNFSHF